MSRTGETEVGAGAEARTTSVPHDEVNPSPVSGVETPAVPRAVPGLCPNSVDAEAHDPLRELDGDTIDGVICRALDRLDARRDRVRDPQTGRWTLANGGRLVTGVHSERFWGDLEPARAAIEQRVCAQLGFTVEDGRETALGLAGAYAEARLIRRSEFLQLTRLEDAPTSAKQRTRRHERRRQHLNAWALAFDRELKAALALGLERKAKQLPPTPADYLRSMNPVMEDTR